MSTIENIHQRINDLITKICNELITFNTSNTSNINNDSRRNLIYVSHNNDNRPNIILERYYKVIKLYFNFSQTENILTRLYQLELTESEDITSELRQLSNDLTLIENQYNNTARTGGNRKRTTLKRRRR
tara:strand:+ start:685 stop:1071 length:387 start_codon:yes stop_codon:yes gene_type:complete